MLKKNRKIIAIVAALSSISSSLLFADSHVKQYSDPSNVSAALGFWLLVISLLLWFVYLLLTVIARHK